MKLCDSLACKPTDPDNRCPAGPLRSTISPDPLRCFRCGGWTPHGALPSRERVALLAQEATSLAGRLADDYAWAHSVAFAPAGSNGRGSRGQSGPHSDPTGNTIADPARVKVRAYTAIAARLVEQAMRAWRNADEAIGEALLAAEPPGPRDHTKAPFHDTIPENRPDLAEPHAARARRHARGEGIPR